MFDSLAQANNCTDSAPDNTGVELVHPYDDPDVWRDEPAYSAPADVDIVQMQKWIDSVMGVTRDNRSIYKLVWNGDRNYWHQFYAEWDAAGRPTKEPMIRPRVRYKVIRDPNTRRPVRDVFPPRWLILTRLEPEQYADAWKQQSYVMAPELSQIYEVPDGKGGIKLDRRNVYKQIRPDEPPPVFWMWYTTIAKHTAYCCTQARRGQRMCYGKYQPPQAVAELLGIQKQADAAAGDRRVFEQVDADFIFRNEEQHNGYAHELASLEIESEIFIENPMALLGLEATLKAGIETEAQARQIVRDHFKREADELSKLI